MGPPFNSFSTVLLQDGGGFVSLKSGSLYEVKMHKWLWGENIVSLKKKKISS